MKRIFLAVIPLMLGGCESIGNWADNVGSYMPVIGGERCEHWQCFTESGKAQSEYNKKMKEKGAEDTKSSQQMPPEWGQEPAPQENTGYSQ